MPEPTSPRVAAALSFAFPGLGQVYAHDFLKGILMLAIGMGLSFLVFPLGVPAFIILLLRASWPTALVLAGIPEVAVLPVLLILLFVLAPASWGFWFYASIHAFEAAERYNEHVAMTPCQTCGAMMPAMAAECPKCGAPPG